MSSPTADPQSAKAHVKLAAATTEEKESTLSPSPPASVADATAVEETGGPAGPEPTRFGDWERKGRCIDF